MPATQKRRRSRDASGIPGACIRPRDSAYCSTFAMQNRRKHRDANGTPGRISEPLIVHIVLCLRHKRGGDLGAPAEPRGVHPTPLTVHIVPYLPRKRSGELRDVHPTPWQCTLSHACHAKAAETQGRQRNPGACICLPHKRDGDAGTPADSRGVHPTP